MIIPVILSSGSGTRFWPMSRKLYPKQFLPMLGGKDTLLQYTLLRLEHIKDRSAPMLICNEAHRFIVAAQSQAWAYLGEDDIVRFEDQYGRA